MRRAATASHFVLVEIAFDPVSMLIWKAVKRHVDEMNTTSSPLFNNEFTCASELQIIVHAD